MRGITQPLTSCKRIQSYLSESCPSHRKTALNFAGRANLLVKRELGKAARRSSRWQPRLIYLGCIVTVNELLEIFVSVPPKVAEPVVENAPAC